MISGQKRICKNFQKSTEKVLQKLLLDDYNNIMRNNNTNTEAKTMHKLVKEYIDFTTATRTKEVKNINVKLPKHISEAILIKEVDDRFETTSWRVRGMTENGTCFSVTVWNEKQFRPNVFKKRFRITQCNWGHHEQLNSTPSVKQACRRIADKLTSACAEFAPTEN